MELELHLGFGRGITTSTFTSMDAKRLCFKTLGGGPQLPLAAEPAMPCASTAMNWAPMDSTCSRAASRTSFAKTWPGQRQKNPSMGQERFLALRCLPRPEVERGRFPASHGNPGPSGYESNLIHFSWPCNLASAPLQSRSARRHLHLRRASDAPPSCTLHSALLSLSGSAKRTWNPPKDSFSKGTDHEDFCRWNRAKSLRKAAGFLTKT